MQSQLCGFRSFIPFIQLQCMTYMPEVKCPNPTVVVYSLRPSSYSLISYSATFLAIYLHLISRSQHIWPKIHATSPQRRLLYPFDVILSDVEAWSAWWWVRWWWTRRLTRRPTRWWWTRIHATSPMPLWCASLRCEGRGHKFQSAHSVHFSTPTQLIWNTRWYLKQGQFFAEQWNGCQGCRRNAYLLCSSTFVCLVRSLVL